MLQQITWQQCPSSDKMISRSRTKENVSNRRGINLDLDESIEMFDKNDRKGHILGKGKKHKREHHHVCNRTMLMWQDRI
tara:strand:- start:141 stop:377 length:237 start_codon:yes stop_codon:yes gene_type:complete